jgi:hypothetical protein
MLRVLEDLLPVFGLFMIVGPLGIYFLLGRLKEWKHIEKSSVKFQRRFGGRIGSSYYTFPLLKVVVTDEHFHLLSATIRTYALGTISSMAMSKNDLSFEVFSKNGSLTIYLTGNGVKELAEILESKKKKGAISQT